MSIFPRPTKQFDFLGKNLRQLNQTQRSLIRRTDFRGVPFDDGVGAASPKAAKTAETRVILPQAQEVTLDWETEAEGYEITGPTFITFTLADQAMLSFRVGPDFHYVWYSNARYLIDVIGTIEKE